jgi:hypothetical protein
MLGTLPHYGITKLKMQHSVLQFPILYLQIKQAQI